MKTLCCLLLLSCVLPLSGADRKPRIAGPADKRAARTNALSSAARTAPSCRQEEAHGLFRPECFASAGSGDTLVTAWDAAFNAAQSYVGDSHLNPRQTGATVMWRGQYDVCNAQQGFVLPQSPVPSGGPGVDLAGDGPGAQLSLVCPIRRAHLPTGALPGSPLSNAAIWMPVQAQPHYTQHNWHDFTLYANGNASGCLDMQGLVHVSSFTNLILSGAAGDGTENSNCMRWGNAQYPQATANQVELHNIGITPGGAAQGTGFAAETTIRNGVPTVLVKRGGQGYSRHVSLYLTGPPTDVDATTGLSSPCRTMGSLRSTVQGGKVTAVQLHGFAGCAEATTIKAFDPVLPVNYAVWFDAFTDSPYIQLNPQTGRIAGVLAGPATGNNVYQGVHVCCGMPTGFIEEGHGDSFLNFYADGVGQRAMSFGAGASATVQQSKLYWNAEAGESSTQAGAYSFGAGVGSVTISGGVCNSTGMQTHGGYDHVVSAQGANRYPATLNVFADEDCSDHHMVTFLSAPFINTLQAALNQNLVLRGSAPGTPAALTVEPSGEITVGGSSRSRLNFAMEGQGADGCKPSLMASAGELAIDQPCGRGQVHVQGGVLASSFGSGSGGSSDLNGSLTLSEGSRRSSTYTFAHPSASAPICWLAPTDLTPAQLQSLNGVVPVITRTELHFEVGASVSGILHLGYACLGRN